MAEKRKMTHASIELGADHLAIAQKLQMKVGSKVRVVLFGELVGLSQYAQDDKSDLTMPASGSLQIDVRNLKLASNNEIADLLEDEDYND